MLSNTVLLLWCLVVSVCWMTETEAWISNSDGKIKRGKQSTMKDLIHYQRNIRNLCSSMKDVCKREADMSSFEKD
ncbi:hypothetical protein ABFA07_015679 [Porites harrisoni]